MNVDFGRTLIMLLRGPKSSHEEHPFKPRPGNFTIVLDAHELRYHDGKRPGGIVIPIPQYVHEDILRQYEAAMEKAMLTRSQMERHNKIVVRIVGTILVCFLLVLAYTAYKL